MRHETIPPVAALLIKARAKVEEGWCQHRLEDGRGVCIKGAINWADHGDACNSYPSYTGYAALAALRGVVYSNIEDFNDAKGRTKAEVLEVFDRAISNVLESVP